MNFLDENGKWACKWKECKASCCSFITPLVEKKRLPREWLRNDGGCINIMMDGSCRIYDKRPVVCRVDRTQVDDLTLAKWCSIMYEHRENSK